MVQSRSQCKGCGAGLWCLDLIGIFGLFRARNMQMEGCQCLAGIFLDLECTSQLTIAKKSYCTHLCGDKVNLQVPCLLN